MVILLKRLICVVLLSPVLPIVAAEFAVHHADEILATMQEAAPGDVLVMADGVWIDQEITFAGHGTPDAPITLRPQTPGGVTLTGASNLSISGSYLVVDGLHFKNGNPGDLSHIVQFRGSLGEATHCRLTQTQITTYNPDNPRDPESRYFWVSLYGQYNRVDHCRFQGQNHSGVTVCVWLDGDIAEHRIDHNHFVDRAPGEGNGFETLRIGTSEFHNTNAGVVVEHNLFERADGEIEIISNKSNDNVFRHNTFRESAGTLTLRHGHRATVENNYFLGMGKQNSGAIRVIGEDHIIRSNYIAGIDDRADGAISLAAGIENTPDNGYQRVKRAKIENNTIVDVRGAGITFDWGMGERKRTLLAEALTITNNLIYSTRAPIFEGQTGDDWTWKKNIVSGATLGIEPREGIDEVDPRLEQGPDGLWRPTADSPVTTQGVHLPPQGGTRHEVETGSSAVMLLPLTANDVGPEWSVYQPVP